MSTLFSSLYTVEVTDLPNHVPATKMVKSGLEISQCDSVIPERWRQNDFRMRPDKFMRTVILYSCY